jgi:hypothetical protein
MDADDACMCMDATCALHQLELFVCLLLLLCSLSLSLHLFYLSVMAAADVSNEQALLLLLPLFQ